MKRTNEHLLQFYDEHFSLADTSSVSICQEGQAYYSLTSFTVAEMERCGPEWNHTLWGV